MPEFIYKAKNRSGKISRGELTAPTKLAAKTSLVNRGLRPISIRAKKEKGKTGGVSGIFYIDDKGMPQIQLTPDLPNIKELAVFTKQFSLMIENGIPLLQSLKLLREQQKKRAFAHMLEDITESIEKGSNLSDAIEPYPQVFDSLYVAMCRAGEASGKLDIILRQLVSYLERTAKIKSQIKAAMTYPMIIVFVAVAVVGLLLTFVVPNFARQFQENGQELPELTQIVVDASNLLLGNFLEIAIGTFLIIGGLIAFIRTDKGKVFFDSYILRVPLFGTVMTKISVGRFCSTMSTMLSSGVAILEALTICASSSGNKEIEGFVLKVKDEISKGQNFHEPLSESPLFPKMVSSMIAVGETTGTLDETLSKITEIYDDEVDNSIAAMTAMIEPLMIVIIGSIVGFIAIAMYLPVFDMASTVGG